LVLGEDPIHNALFSGQLPAECCNARISLLIPEFVRSCCSRLENEVVASLVGIDEMNIAY
jgi:hypothetical protein